MIGWFELQEREYIAELQKNLSNALVSLLNGIENLDES